MRVMTLICTPRCNYERFRKNQFQRKVFHNMCIQLKSADLDLEPDPNGDLDLKLNLDIDLDQGSGFGSGSWLASGAMS